MPFMMTWSASMDLKARVSRCRRFTVGIAWHVGSTKYDFDDESYATTRSKGDLRKMAVE